MPVLDLDRELAAWVVDRDLLLRAIGQDAQRHGGRFTTFEQFDRPGLTPEIRVRGGRLESLAVVPIDLE